MFLLLFLVFVPCSALNLASDFRRIEILAWLIAMRKKGT